MASCSRNRGPEGRFRETSLLSFPGMRDTLTIVADTLRTMMGATAAEPYIRAIESEVAKAAPPTTIRCRRCGRDRVERFDPANREYPLVCGDCLVASVRQREPRPLDAVDIQSGSTGKITTR